MGREEGKKKGRGGRRGEEEGKGGEGENDLTHPLSQIPGYATDCTTQKLNWTVKEE